MVGNEGKGGEKGWAWKNSLGTLVNQFSLPGLIGDIISYTLHHTHHCLVPYLHIQGQAAHLYTSNVIHINVIHMTVIHVNVSLKCSMQLGHHGKMMTCMTYMIPELV